MTNFVRTVEYAGYKNIYKIVRFLYQDPPVWMERKRSIAINYLLTKYPNDQWLLDQASSSQVTKAGEGGVDRTIHTEYSEALWMRS